MLDAGSADAGRPTVDAGPADGGPGDGGSADAGPGDAGAPDGGAVDAGAVPMGAVPPFVTAGGASASSDGYRARFTIGAPQPMGTATGSGRRVRLGPTAAGR